MVATVDKKETTVDNTRQQQTETNAMGESMATPTMDNLVARTNEIGALLIEHDLQIKELRRESAELRQQVAELKHNLELARLFAKMQGKMLE